MNKAFKATIAGAVLALAGGGLALAAPAAHANTPLVNVTTHLSDDGAFFGNGFQPYGWSDNHWANDTFNRTLTISEDSNFADCNTVGGFNATTDVCYLATIQDTGSALTIGHAHEPNQGTLTGVPNGTSLPSVPETLSFSGGANFHFYVFNSTSGKPNVGVVPDPADVNTGTISYADVTDAGSGFFANRTQDWFLQAFPPSEWKLINNTIGVFPSGAGLQDDFSWTYSSGCETWVDSFPDYGQSNPITVHGNITGEVCPAPTPPPSSSPPPVTITFSSYGNNVNPFGNGFDVYQQHARVNQMIVGWPATQHDPATHFLRNSEGGGRYQFEYAPNGVGDGLCVSNPGNNALVLRGCNSNIWQQWSYAGGHVISALNGGIVNPDGTGAQLTVGSAAVPWGGSSYTWTDFAHLAA